MALDRTGWFALAIAAAIVVYQCLLPPAVGIADNGDSAKIIGRYDLRAPGEAPDRDTFRYLRLRYTFEPAHHYVGGFTSSETLLFWLALGLNWMVSKDGAFDIRVMGTVHAALFLAAFALLAHRLRRAPHRRRALLLALAVLIFCDVMYASQYNTFYMDTGAFVFLLLTFAFLLRALEPPPAPPVAAWLALLWALLLVTSKAQHALLGVPLAAFFYWKRKALWPGRPRLSGSLAAGAVTLAAAASLIWGNPPRYNAAPLFNVIFLQILPRAENPRAELASLGLDDSYLPYKGMYTYEARSPMHVPAFAREFERRASYSRLLKFYLAHPRRAFRLLRLGLEQAAEQRPWTGTFDRSAGYPPSFRSSAFSAWSAAKNRVFRWHGWRYLVVFLLAAMVVAWRSPAAGAVLAAMGSIELAIGSLADACETLRHLFIFNTIWDLTLFAAVCAIPLSTRPINASPPAPGATRDP